MDETTLVQRAQRGDVDAFRQLVRVHQTIAFRVAVVVAGNAADAEDAANDALVKAFYALAGFRVGAPFRPWLLRIVANEAHNRRRSADRRARLAGRAQLASLSSGDTAPSPEDTVLTALKHEALLAAVNQLEPRHREVIALRFLVGLSESETAAALDCPVGTAKSRLHRALGRLRSSLQAEASDA